MNNRYICLFILILIGFSGCARQSDGDREAALRTEGALACHNSYFGIVLTVPKGWWIYDLNTANFSPDPEDTEEMGMFDIIYNEDSYHIELISFANVRSFGRKKYVGLDMAVDSDDKLPAPGGFLRHFEGFSADQGDFSLTDSGSVSICGTVFEKYVYETSAYRGKLKIIALSTGLKTGGFLHISAVCWPQNKNAEYYIIELINRALALE